MSTPPPILYKLFIIHAKSDKAWVNGHLIPELNIPKDQLLTNQRLPLGMSRAEAYEYAITHSTYTLMVLTPSFLDDAWSEFAPDMASYLGVKEQRTRLIPLYLKPCDPPLRFEFLVSLSCIDPDDWAEEIDRLREAAGLPKPGVGEAPWRQQVRQVRRWRFRHQRAVKWGGVAAVLLLLALMIFADIPPFGRQEGWVAISPKLRNVQAGYDTGVTFVVGAANEGKGCTHSENGVWYRPVNSAQWLESSVGQVLCFPYGNKEALDNVQAIAGFPEQPDTVYLLTEHKGILVSRDGGAAFSPYPTGVPPIPQDDYALSLALGGTPATPVFWVNGKNRGLWRMDEGAWVRMDGNAGGGCAGLPDSFVSGLLSTGDRMVIGTAGNGLWVSEDGGGSCHRVFDAGGTYTFHTLLHASIDQQDHYFAAVEVTLGEPEEDYGRFQLLHLCPRAGSCTAEAWSADSIPLWHNGTFLTGTLAQVVLTSGADQSIHWVVFTGFGKVIEGNLEGEQWRIGAVRRCWPLCELHSALVPASQDGAKPYILSSGWVYQYGEGKWLQSLWP